MTHGRRWIRTSLGWLVLLAGAFIGACNGSAQSTAGSLQRVVSAPLPPPDQSLVVQFLGAGGVYLRQADQALLGDPFFSNPPLSHWVFGRALQVKADVIDAHLPPMNGVQGILVGHGHFDHALDIPYIAGKLPDSVKVYGSETIPNLFAATLPAARLVDLTPSMSAAGEGGQWVYLSPRLRILPIQSQHSPHVADIVFASDRITHPLSRAPAAMFDWQAGTNLTFVIDFLDAAQQVKYRVFYQSSASPDTVGFPPDWLLAEDIPVDLALLCAANYNHVDGYPEGILQALRPRQVMLIHWERFWDDYSTETATPLPGMNFADLEARIRSVLAPSVPVWLPMRGGSIQLEH